MIVASLTEQQKLAIKTAALDEGLSPFCQAALAVLTVKTQVVIILALASNFIRAHLALHSEIIEQPTVKNLGIKDCQIPPKVSSLILLFLPGSRLS